MRKFIFLLLFLVPTYVFSQDSIAIVHTIDSIWSVKLKTKKRRFKSDYDSLNYRVWYDKTTGEILSIEESHYPVNGGTTKFWIYNYHFRDGKLIFLTKYNNTNIKDYRRQICYYYFLNDKLHYKHEFRTSILDIPGEQEKAYGLKKKFDKL